MIEQTDKLFHNIVKDVEEKTKNWCSIAIGTINAAIPNMDPAQLKTEIDNNAEYAQNTLLLVHEVQNLMKVLKYVAEKLPNSQDARSLIVEHINQIDTALTGEYDVTVWEDLLESTKTLCRLFGNMIGLNEYK